MYIKKILIAVAILGVVALAGFSYYIYNSIFSANTSFSEDQVAVYIPTGATYQTVIDSITPLVKNLESFDIVAQKKEYPKSIKAGRFLLSKGMNNNELVNRLRSGNTPISLSFNNQERLEDLAGRIGSQIEADSAALISTFRDQNFLKENNFTEAQALAMYIPNSYEFFWNTTADEFRSRMLKEYKRFWTEERLQKAKALNLNPKEVSVIASIVQKETVKIDERPRVAGVYINRYKNGWKLDADPTVIYAIKKANKDFDTIIRRVLYKDLEIDSPYNTYKYKELPPGPIAMPDISSIDAVLNYEEHDYFYFVADVQNLGYHKFAETLAQHNRNKQEYVRWINKKGIRR